MTVTDHGTGMDAEELALAVTEFGRLSTSAFISSEHPGTGLGLPISIGFMTLLGGRLEIESTKGAGTSVRIVLPRARRRTDAGVPEQAAAGRRRRRRLNRCASQE